MNLLNMILSILLSVTSLLIGFPVDTSNLLDFGHAKSQCIVQDVDNINNIVVLIEFKDGPKFTENNLKAADKAYNEVNDKDNSTSLKEYINKISYGKLNVDSHIYPIDDQTNTISPYISEHNKGYYMPKTSDNFEGYRNKEEGRKRVGELLNSAVLSIKNQIPDDLNIDDNNDGKVDAITFIYDLPIYEKTAIDFRDYGKENKCAKNTKDYTSSKSSEYETVNYEDALWPQWWSEYGVEQYIGNLEINGKKINSLNVLTSNFDGFDMFNIDKQNTATMTHEFMHVLGFPDLYRSENSSEKTSVGMYDLMETSQGDDPQKILEYYRRDFAKWGPDINEVSKSTENITLTASSYDNPDVQSSIKIKGKNNNKEYFVVEYRKKQGLDSSLENLEDGIIVYRINEKTDPTIGNIDSTSRKPDDFAYVFRPNEKRANSCTGDIDKATLSQESGRTSFGNTDTSKYSASNKNNSIYYSNGKNSGIVIYNVGSNASDTITFSVKIPN